MALRKRDWAALGGLAYAVLLMVWIPPDPWMVAALGYGTVILVLVGAFAIFVQTEHRKDEGVTSGPPPWQQALPWAAAGILFVVVAVLSAALETRGGITRTYLLLGIGMVWSVALLLVAYDRSRSRAGPDDP